MALRAEFSLIHSELNGFLYAPIGDEDSGTELTVLSALARLALDPWGEAARLSTLPKDIAAAALASLIARLPRGRWAPSDVPAIAARLVQLLPERGPAPPPSGGRSEHPAAGESERTNSPAAALWLIALILCTVYLGLWSLRSEPEAPRPGSALSSSPPQEQIHPS